VTFVSRGALADNLTISIVSALRNLRAGDCRNYAFAFDSDLIASTERIFLKPIPVNGDNGFFIVADCEYQQLDCSDFW
jgi:hypothetical protein